jgi:hypothetical protein
VWGWLYIYNPVEYVGPKIIHKTCKNIVWQEKLKITTY